MKKEIFMEKLKLLQLGTILILISSIFLVGGCLSEKLGGITSQGDSYPCPKDSVKDYIKAKIEKSRTRKKAKEWKNFSTKEIVWDSFDFYRWGGKHFEL